MKKTNVRIVMIQLPLLDHNYNYIDGNIPYAQNAIKAFIHEKLDVNVDISILSNDEVNFLNNEKIAEIVKEKDPDIVGFTTYLWNAERNLKIAKKLKKIKNFEIIFGGPEISKGSYLLEEKRKNVDIFVIGEGEWFFGKYLLNGNLKSNKSLINGNLCYIQKESELLDKNEIVEPFTKGYLKPYYDNSIFLEISRGCPFRCVYCQYSKNSLKVREQSVECLKNAIKLGNNMGLKEIYFLSPAFDRMKNFNDFLKELNKLNKGISLHTEMRTDRIDKEKAHLLKQAGFNSLEVGVQTLNKNSLKRIRRNTDTKKELIGIKNLKEAGIDLKIGIIPGLPDDDADNFKKTIERLCNEGLGNEIEYYPLMILPGTEMRQISSEENYNYQKKPPYFFINNNKFSFDDVFDLKKYIEEKTGFYSTSKKLPDFTSDDNSELTKGIKFNSEDKEQWVYKKKKTIFHRNVIDYHIIIKNEETIYENIGKILNKSKILFNVIFYFNDPIDEYKLLKIVNSYEKDNFNKRIHLYDDLTDSLKCYFYQVVDNFEKFIDINKKYYFIEPIYKMNLNEIEKLSKLKKEAVNVLVDENVYSKENKWLVKKYKDSIEKVAFIKFENYKDYSLKLNIPFIEPEMKFKIINY